ncbi:MAG: YgiT-type zinc finger protein [Methanosarcinales archaeon]|nr:MAG: YgiT-type zinc finger protein [Methanosarcinales archaeon]
MKCPICEEGMERKKVPYTIGSVKLGTFEADVCSSCGEIFFTEKSSDAIDRKAKELGVWGLEKKGRIGYSGNSLIVRIPKKVAEFMKLKKGEGILIKPEDKKRLVIEIE